MKINVEIVPHNDQRYETCGDWFLDSDGVLQVRISKLSNPCYERLILIHEIVEFLLESQKRGGDLSAMEQLVKETDAFDKAYEAARPSDDNESEPGCEPQCPAYQGHMAASAIENIAAMILGVNYNKYAEEVGALTQTKGESNG